MESKSWVSSSAMAESPIAIRNLLLRCWTASDDSGEVVVILVERSGDSASIEKNNVSTKLLLKAAERVVVLCVFDGDFMVVLVGS
jgi:hypothetical protein